MGTADAMDSFQIINTEELTDSINTIHSPSIGQPRRLIHIWLRVMLLFIYLIFSFSAIYIMIIDEQLSNGYYAFIIITIILPTILLFAVLCIPRFHPRISSILFIVVIILRAIQWIITVFIVIDNIEPKDTPNEFRDKTDDLFAISGALLNECGFLFIVWSDYRTFYVQKDYDSAIFSVHYSSQKAIKSISALLCISSILWFIYCFNALGDESEYIDTYFYLLLTLFTASFLLFEYVMEPKWGNKIGFILCCIFMLLILFIWGDEELMSFSDVATAAILPQIMCLSFAYFKKF